MSMLLKLRLGVADDPGALQPALNDCLAAVLRQSDLLMKDVLQGLVQGLAPVGPQSVAAFQAPAVKQAILALHGQSAAVCARFKDELSRAVYQGGGKEQAHTQVLRYEDLQLFGDAELDQSIEVARALQQAALAVNDVLPALDALVSTLLGWRTIQPGLNPLRPEVFVQALQVTLAQHVQDGAAREALMTPAAGLLGADLRRIYKELADWLRTSGVEPAVPVGGRPLPGAGAGGASAGGAMARTLLTLDRLRKLLAGDFDPPQKGEFLHTVPASMALLQEMKQVDTLVQRLEQRPRPAPPPAPAATGVREDVPAPRLGRQLGCEVLRLMFDTLVQDERLLPAFKQQLKRLEPPVQRLAERDSRFFSDRTHPARQFLDRITQRSLAFQSESDEGWPRFLDSVQDAVRRLQEQEAPDADAFGGLLEQLQALWARQDQALRARREDAARALLHAEQRNLLAEKLAADFAAATEGLDIAPFVVEFLKGSWAQVVAEAQLSCTDGSDDPFDYRALVEDLVWSVQKSTAQRSRARRLVQMIPGLLARLRAGLERIHYPPELTERFFDNLMTLHQAALRGSDDPVVRRAAEELEAAPRSAQEPAPARPWLAQEEVQESGWIDEDSVSPEDLAAADLPPPAHEAPAEPAPVRVAELRTGTWAELRVDGLWTRVQLTWASPHGTLFMFTSLAGTAHSMSRRTLDKLRAQGLLRVVADRPVVDDALDQVANAALKNSLDGQPAQDGDPPAE